MKIKAIVILTAILLVSVLAVAETGTGTLVLRDKAVVNGKQLAAGEYKVKWDGNGSVEILQGKKQVATAKVTVKELDKASANDTVIYKTDKDTRMVSELRFGGKKTTLIFEN